MKVITDLEFGNFLATASLYYKLKVVEDYRNEENTYAHLLDFTNKPFKFLCPNENEVHTFRTELPKGTYTPSRTWSTEDGANHLPEYFDDTTGYLDLTINLKGVCQSCKKNIDISLRTTSDKEWDKRDTGINIFVQKIGQYPPVSIEPDKDIKSYLTQEDRENYKKALTTLSFNFGIGAYAYFRRIIENEIKRMIKDIAELEFDGANDVKNAYQTFEVDHQTSKLIDILNKFLPGSLKQFGDNPLRLLYEQLSGGIHEFSEQQCIEKAKQINILLTFVIRKINEEKYQLQDVKEAMMKLRSNPPLN